MKEPTDDLISELREQIRRLERSWRRPTRAVFSTGLETLDDLFPQKGIATGALIEWLSESEGSGAMALALVLAGRVQADGGLVVVLDDAGVFYPPAAQLLGVSLEQTLVIETRQVRDALWAWEQALRSCAVAVALGRIDTLGDRVFRRLQLAAEAGGSVGFLLRPAARRPPSHPPLPGGGNGRAARRAEPSWAEARFLVEALPSTGLPSSPRRRLRVELLHGRGGGSRRGGSRSVDVELTDEADVVRLVSPLAHPAASSRPARD